MYFVDEATITVSSGKGGAGAVSFRREAMTPRGGPDGGDGGKGGDVIFRTDERLGSLLDLRYRQTYAAENGEPGKAANMSGHAGADVVISVPPGTVIKNEDGSIICDLQTDGELVFLKGGRGGKGNAFFKTSINQAPDRAQPGESGQAVTVHLELKLLADIGIIGYPNAGKSTLISRISAARPKIADYPFTTLVPNLGVVRLDDLRSFIVADIPGLIPGAHEGVGLGTQFLRHIERTRLFLHVVDISGFSGRDPVKDIEEINFELQSHDEMNKSRAGYQALADRPQILVLNKADLIPPENRADILAKIKQLGFETYLISAATGSGIKELIFAAGRRLYSES